MSDTTKDTHNTQNVTENIRRGIQIERVSLGCGK